MKTATKNFFHSATSTRYEIGQEVPQCIVDDKVVPSDWYEDTDSTDSTDSADSKKKPTKSAAKKS